MKILFLDQSGKPGGAELCLADIARPYRDHCLVGLFADGSFKTLLEQQHIPVQVLASQPIAVSKSSGWWQGIQSVGQLVPLIAKVTQMARDYDLIYANTQKALVVGAIASALSQNRCPLVYHLHDIVSPEHFSRTNRQMIITLANRFAAQVIANSKASQTAFVAAGGRADLTQVIYNGFDPKHYEHSDQRDSVRQALKVQEQFVVGLFSRLSPWKGQHVLMEALADCPAQVVALLVGDALFGEQDYADQLRQQVVSLGLEQRVQFLGFRSDIPQLMAACDLIAHTSTAAEPFGRVVVEGMLCGRPVVATQAGGVTEIITPGETGWLTPPGDAAALAAVIRDCYAHPDQARQVASAGRLEASQRFDAVEIHQQIDHLLRHVVAAQILA